MANAPIATLQPALMAFPIACPAFLKVVSTLLPTFSICALKPLIDFVASSTPFFNLLVSADIITFNSSFIALSPPPLYVSYCRIERII